MTRRANEWDPAFSLQVTTLGQLRGKPLPPKSGVLVEVSSRLCPFCEEEGKKTICSGDPARWMREDRLRQVGGACRVVCYDHKSKSI